VHLSCRLSERGGVRYVRTVAGRSAGRSGAECAMCTGARSPRAAQGVTSEDPQASFEDDPVAWYTFAKKCYAEGHGEQCPRCAALVPCDHAPQMMGQKGPSDLPGERGCVLHITCCISLAAALWVLGIEVLVEQQ